jgi:hypothetical protein
MIKRENKCVIKEAKLKKQREMTRFKKKKNLGLCPPFGTWALDLRPSPSHYDTPSLKNNIVYYTPRAVISMGLCLFLGLMKLVLGTWCEVPLSKTVLNWAVLSCNGTITSFSQ